MLNTYIISFLISIALVFSTPANGKFVHRFETTKEGLKKVSVYKATEGGTANELVCQAVIANTYLTNGWEILRVDGYPQDQGTDEDLAECVGRVEGLIIPDQIWYYYNNNIKQFCKGRKPVACQQVIAFLRKHLDWLESYSTNNSNVDIWYQASLFLTHVKGLYSGYTDVINSTKYAITQEEFMLMNLKEDLEDVFDALAGDISAKVKGRSRCSALIKLLPGNEDLLVAHNTWTSYVQMNRVLKYYSIPFKTHAGSKKVVPGNKMMFSGYPGVISSVDDFYASITNLVALETTIGNSNASLWSYVQPTGQIMESMRSVIALRLAKNGKSWSKIFSQFNSGTYNNQWMIVDYNKFKHGKSPRPGTLFILEQIPGHIRYADQTKVLNKQQYWPSYNTAFYQDIFNLSGNQELVQEYGDWFTYDKTPRAEIFRRDHSTVADTSSMMTLMRSNNYKNDEFGKCNCNPPYSAENAIAARSDLNPANGTYPFDSLGHRCHGAIDAKIMSTEYLNNWTFMAVSGPTTGTDLPEFNWTTTDYKDQPHMGQPDTFTNFEPILVQWPDY